MLDTWRDWGVKPKEGDWRLLRKHIKEVLANGNDAVEEYILDWTAHGYQRPGVKRCVALVFQGAEGVGKGVFGHALRRSYGSHGLYIAQPSQLVGKFNKHLRTICYIFADEAFFAGNKPHEDILKSLITEGTMMVEPKGVDAFLVPNHIDVVMASNHKWVVPVGEFGRRFAVTEVSPKYGKGHCSDAERKAYFDPLFEEINRGGIEAMMWDLLRRPLDDWDPEAFPVTKALMKQKQLTLRGYDKAMESWLQTGDLPRDQQWEGRPDCATSAAMMSAIRKIRGCEYDPDGGIKAYLKEHFPEVDTTWRVPGRGLSGAKFPSLAECRATFAARFGGSWPWDEEVQGWGGERG
jgi:hypothetical protein